MKKAALILSLVLFTMIEAFAQIETPVTWSYAAKKINAKEAMLYIKASIDPNWHIYSQNIKSGGPVKTNFTFSTSKDYVLIGKTLEPKAISKYEDTFKMNVSYFEDQVIFKQKVKLNRATTIVKGKLEYAACNATRCLAPEEIEFNIPIKN